MSLNLLQTFPHAHDGKGWSVTWNPSPASGFSFPTYSDSYNSNGGYQQLISCGEDKIAKVWKFYKKDDDQDDDDPSSHWGLELQTKFGTTSHQKTIRSVSISPCGKWVLLASFDAQVTLWEIKTGQNRAAVGFEMVSVVEGHENEVKSVAWSASGKYFASCGRDKNVMIW